MIGTAVRLFVLWNQATDVVQSSPPLFDRVHVPELAVRDMFDDAFMAIARDGAGSVEVGLCLQKGLRALAHLENAECEPLRRITRAWRSRVLKRR